MKQEWVLWNIPDSLAKTVLVPCREWFAVQQHRSGRRDLQSEHEIGDRGLSRSRFAYECCRLTLLNAQVDASQGLRAPRVGEFDLAQFQALLQPFKSFTP